MGFLVTWTERVRGGRAECCETFDSALAFAKSLQQVPDANRIDILGPTGQVVLCYVRLAGGRWGLLLEEARYRDKGYACADGETHVMRGDDV